MFLVIMILDVLSSSMYYSIVIFRKNLASLNVMSKGVLLYHIALFLKRWHQVMFMLIFHGCELGYL
jgi:hypothetical protein